MDNMVVCRMMNKREYGDGATHVLSLCLLTSIRWNNNNNEKKARTVICRGHVLRLCFYICRKINKKSEIDSLAMLWIKELYRSVYYCVRARVFGRRQCVCFDEFLN